MGNFYNLTKNIRPLNQTQIAYMRKEMRDEGNEQHNFTSSYELLPNLIAIVNCPKSHLRNERDEL